HHLGQAGFPFLGYRSRGFSNSLRIYRYRRSTVVTLQQGRAGTVADVGKLGEADLLALRIDEVDLRHILNTCPVGFVKDDVDVVLVASGTEFIVGVSAEGCP